MAEQLKACPFCGGEAKIVDWYISGVANHKNYFVMCKVCGRNSKNRNALNKAVSEWNTRPIEDKQAELIDLLASELEEMKAGLPYKTSIGYKSLKLYRQWKEEQK